MLNLPRYINDIFGIFTALSLYRELQSQTITLDSGFLFPHTPYPLHNSFRQSQTITLDSGFLFPHTPCPMLFCRFKKVSKEKST